MWVGVCFAAKVVPLQGLMKPFSIEASDTHIYISDGFNVKIFSLADFKLKRTFGKKGEGPKEFKGFILAYVQPDHIFINSPNKVSYFTLDGEFIKETRMRHIFGRFKPLGKNRFVGYHYSREGNTRYESIYLFNSKFDKVKELYRREFIIDKNREINFIEERPPFFYIVDNKVFLDGVDGVIYVFDSTGQEIAGLRCPCERIPFTKEHKLRFIDYFKNHPETRDYYHNIKDRMTFPDYFPPIRMFHVTDNKIYVMTYKEKNGKNELVIMDTNGKLLNKVFLPIAPFEESTVLISYTIRNGRLYHLKDNEETEEWELRIYDIK
jgi:hypothetical protein